MNTAVDSRCVSGENEKRNSWNTSTGVDGKVPEMRWFGCAQRRALLIDKHSLCSERETREKFSQDGSQFASPASESTAASCSGGRPVQAREGNAGQAAVVGSRGNSMGSHMQSGDKHSHTHTHMENPQARRRIELFIAKLWLPVTPDDPGGRQAQRVKLIKTLLCEVIFP